MSEPFLGIITVAAFNYAPRGWALCDGAYLIKQQNEALYSLIGTLFGGNGIIFALPDLRGRATVAPGNSGWLSYRELGETGGSETVALSTLEMPYHFHSAYAAGSADQVAPTMHIWGGSDAYPVPLYAPWSKEGPKVTLNPATLQAVGANRSHENMSPYLVMNYIIAVEGIYPLRDDQFS
jgi:microcystin-dependent protein